MQNTNPLNEQHDAFKKEEIRIGKLMTDAMKTTCINAVSDNGTPNKIKAQAFIGAGVKSGRIHFKNEFEKFAKTLSTEDMQLYVVASLTESAIARITEAMEPTSSIIDEIERIIGRKI